MPPPLRCTIKHIAARAGVAVSTVSYALRNHPSIPPATCQRIQALAAELGYRPDPQISALMAHIGRGRPVQSAGRIALVWVHGGRDLTRAEPFFAGMREGASARAGLRGYHLEEFWPAEDRLSGARLSGILRTRGISSVIFSPGIEGVSANLQLAWEHFACVVLGHARWPVELHRVAHDHYHAVGECLQRMTALGVQRPAIVLTEEIDLRTDKAVRAAFMTHHPSESKARSLIYALDRSPRPAFGRWLRLHDPDGVLLLRREMWAEIAHPGLERLRQARRVWCANWQADDPLGLPGIQQRYDLAARAAVDLVTGLEQSRSFGLPDHPQWVQIRGDWHPQPGVPAAAATPARS
ncbi:LacI family DNA-binding transcriptional regulator [Opitutus sp. ER46]|uniref:LacI family DNA-binding transcriptional regulator n=1 Tax=Opitutus sp. ER46 TaxID=2161864 RepID=UPI00130500D4|nr:LacI family DNA-binding transcriptional regulator [Opitutus sp. ER46]